MFKPVIINAKTINDAWHQLVFQVEEKGRKYKITQGSFVGQFRYEFEFVLVEIERPWEEMAIIFPPGITLPLIMFLKSTFRNIAMSFPSAGTIGR